MPVNGGAQHSPQTVALCLDNVNGGGRQGPKLEPPEYGGQAPITFHILTTHAAQPLEHYFTTNAAPVPAERRLGMPPPAGVSGPPKMGIGIGRLCHWTVWANSGGRTLRNRQRLGFPHWHFLGQFPPKIHRPVLPGLRLKMDLCWINAAPTREGFYLVLVQPGGHQQQASRRGEWGNVGNGHWCE